MLLNGVVRKCLVNLLFVKLALGASVSVPSSNDIVCYGTSNGFTRMGYDVNRHYDSLRKRYNGCTFVHGNLEITHLEHENSLTFDLGFLSSIRMVTGYVLFVSNTVDVIPLNRLVYVRGDSVFRHNGEDYVFFMALNHSPRGIVMPELKEITGNVAIKLNEVCFVDTIVWDDIAKGKVEFLQGPTELKCENCSADCQVIKGGRHCWGAGPKLCQEVQNFECDWLCRKTSCYSASMLGCCHPECVGGCTDGWIDTACNTCRNFYYKGHCVKDCPLTTYMDGQECIDI